MKAQKKHIVQEVQNSSAYAVVDDEKALGRTRIDLPGRQYYQGQKPEEVE